MTELILLQIQSINKDLGSFIAALLSNDLTKDQQLSFGHRLVDLAEMVLERAEQTTVIIEGYFDEQAHAASSRPSIGDRV